MSNRISDPLFLTASWLTEPICYAHEMKVRLSLPGISLADRIKKGTLLVLCGIVGLLSGLVGLGVRALAQTLAKNPYSYRHGEAQEQIGAPQSLFTLNTCFIPGGQPFTHGGVAPWQERVGGIANLILREDCDVVTLQEMHDVRGCHAMIDHLKQKYTHFYYNIGPSKLSVCSGLFVASKCAIDDPQFIPFDAAADGTAAWVKKGFFSFKSGERRIVTTHLQHSENDVNPTEKEIACRKGQLKQLFDAVNDERDLLISGDFNAQPEEITPLLQNITTKFETTCYGNDLMQQIWPNKYDENPPCTLDYILERGTAQGSNVWEVLPTATETPNLSDHLALTYRA